MCTSVGCTYFFTRLHDITRVWKMLEDIFAQRVFISPMYGDFWDTTMSCTYQLNENSLSLSVQTIMSLGKTWTNETNGRGAGISVLTPGANWVRAKTSDELFPHTAVHCLWKMSFKPNSGIIRVGRRTHVPQGSRYGSLPGNMQEELLFAAER